MPNPSDTLSQQLTGKDKLQDCSVEEIRRLAERYPSFAPAQFLLLHKLREQGLTAEAETQYRKAVLYYPDPVAFEVFISSGRFFTDETDAAYPDTITETSAVDATLEPIQADETEVEDNLSFSSFEDRSQDRVSNIETKEIADTTELADDTTLTLPPVEDPFVMASPNEVDVEKPAAEEMQVPENNNETPAVENEAVPATFAAEPKAAEPLAFEPFHTVDYFASQGIKVVADDVPKDKLGRQLKSFTEWLKTMKRLPDAQVETTPESVAERSVESLADRSVTNSNVVTEAMAEVWAKQGKAEKAAEIYHKLSLLYPSKKPYFAAKIDNLKLF